MIVLYIIYAFIGIGVIIFLHELGHFLAAKKVGVRVERFCIGFDPPFRGHNLRFFSFKRGETEYAIGMIPFGGYVKMAGETALDTNQTGASDELTSKSVGARGLVFVAGAAMNIISAFFFFIIAFSIGVKFIAPEIGTVAVGSPAWEAGLRPGDKITAVDGKPILEFTELMVSVALGSKGEPVRMTIERPRPAAGGTSTDASQNVETETLEIAARPRWDPQTGFNSIGVIQAVSNVVSEVETDGPGPAEGLREGDRIVGLEVDGVVLPTLHTSQLLEVIRDLRTFRPRERLDLRVLRDNEERLLGLSPQQEEGVEPGRQVGIAVGMGNVVRAIRPGSEARNAFQPGDEIVGLGTKTINSLHWLSIHAAILENGPEKGAELDLVVRSSRRPDTEPRRITLDAHDFLRWHLSGEIYWADYLTTVGSVEPQSPLAEAGVKDGDTLVQLNDTPCYHPESIGEILDGDTSGTFSLLIDRGGAAVSLSAPRSALEDLSSITWRTMPPLSAVTQGGPADKAGVEPGALMLAVGAKPVGSWNDLIEAVSALEPEAEVELKWKTVEGETKTGVATVGLVPLEPLFALGFRQQIIRAGIRESCALGARRTIVVSKWVFLTLRSLFRREVSAKNLQGPIGIAHVLTKVSEQGFATLVYFLAIISVNLGLFNLLPFPILDGGHLLFLAIEKIKGSPVDIRIQEWATNIAFLLIISLAVFVTFNDLSRLFN